MRYKEKITKYLQDNNIYNDFDEILIDQLIIYLDIVDAAKKDIDETGLKHKQIQNSSIHTLTTASKNITTILTKLGLTVQERRKLKNNISTSGDIDDFLDYE